MFFKGKVDFKTVKTKNLRNPRDRAPLTKLVGGAVAVVV